jgi:hypothetical protein
MKRSARGATGARGESVRTSGRRTTKVRKIEARESQEEDDADVPASGGSGKWIILGTVVIVIGVTVLAYFKGWIPGLH